MEFLTERWLFPAAMVGLVILLAIYGAAYFHAMRPRTGTLEWIALYDRPAFSLVGRWHALTGKDALAALGCLVLGAALWGVAGWFRYRELLQEAWVSAELPVTLAVTYLLLPGLSALGAYLLFRGLLGRPAAAVLAVAAIMLDLSAEPVTVVFVVWSGLFLCRFLTAGEECSFGEACPNLILAFALLAVGPYFSPALVWLAAADLLILLICCIGRFVHLGRGWLWGSLATALGTVVVTTLALYIPAALLAGMRFPQLLFTREYYLLIWQRLSAIGLAAFQPWLWMETLVVFLYDWPMLLCGLGGLVAALAALFGRWDPVGLVLTIWWLAMAAMAGVGNTFCMPLACGCCLCMVWSDLFDRERKYLAWLGAGCLLAAQLLLYVYGVLL